MKTKLTLLYISLVALLLQTAMASVANFSFSPITRTGIPAPVIYQFPLTTDHQFLGVFHSANKEEYIEVLERSPGLAAPHSIGLFSVSYTNNVINPSITARFASDAFRAYITTGPKLADLSTQHPISTSKPQAAHVFSKKLITVILTLVALFIGYVYYRTQPKTKP
jgi:hypothetical protein